MLTVETKPLKPRVVIHVPGSKSYTHRLLIAAALSDGPCRITNALHSEDTLLTMQALRQMGIDITQSSEDLLVHGRKGRFKSVDAPINLGNSGTSMRLLGGLAVLGEGHYRLTGSSRMCQRPVQALIDSLQLIGIPARSEHNDGCPPLLVPGGYRQGGRTCIDCSISSQYLSALLLIAPYLKQGLMIEVVHDPVSKPYIDMTLDVMQRFGIIVRRRAYEHFQIAGGQTYRHGDHRVESDASQAGYFWAAAAITGTRIKVSGVTQASLQGDVGLADVLSGMGCRVDHEPDGIAVTGGQMHAIDIDMGHMPDMVPTLAVVAAFAQGTTTIRNVAHLRVKESDRLAAVARELSKLGINARSGANDLCIEGGRPHGAIIDTYDDHRLAMSFAVAGLLVPGVSIRDEGCVNKSFPDFWQVLTSLFQ